MEAVHYSQNPKRLSLFLIIVGSLFIGISAYLALFENFSFPALFVSIQIFVLHKISKRQKYSIRIDDECINYDLLEKKDRLAISEIKNIEIKLFEIHIEKQEGETYILNLEHIKDRELKKIKASFQQLKKEVLVAA